MHSCNQMVHSYFARYSRNRKKSAKNARYLPFLSDICLYLSKSHNWGGRGRWFKSSHSDQKVRWLLNFRTFYFSILQLSAKVITKVITSSFRIHWFSYMFKYIQKGYLVRYPFYLSYDFKSIVKVFAKGNSS